MVESTVPESPALDPEVWMGVWGPDLNHLHVVAMTSVEQRYHWKCCGSRAECRLLFRTSTLLHSVEQLDEGAVQDLSPAPLARRSTLTLSIVLGGQFLPRIRWRVQWVIFFWRLDPVSSIQASSSAVISNQSVRILHKGLTHH
jgi:hypothetical protein